MISPEIIDQVRDRTRISELIGEHVKLERRGRSLVGLCPFHKEKTPSFHVNDERGSFHCFGCQASGDCFKYVMETEGLSFIEAIRRLGERAGVEIQEDESLERRKERSEQKRREDELYNVGQVAAAYFEKMLKEHPGGVAARAELERRGLPWEGPHQEVLRSFRIGYAPHGWDGLANYLQRAGVNARAAETVGLLGARKQGSGHYDRFRHRLMFAVVDLQGRIVAFSGRALTPLPGAAEDGDPPAKYINSPESPIYRKRETVFGLYQARSALRGGSPCILVEGNFDVLSLHARGVPSAVAPLGTAFTAEQARHIRRFTSEVVLLFDGDAAGRKAVIASRGPCAEADLRARVATLPQGTDPDDFSRKNGAEGIGRLLSAAPGLLDHLINVALDDGLRPGDSQALAAKIQEVKELIGSEPDAAVRDLAKRYANERLAGRLGVADSHNLQTLNRLVSRDERKAVSSTEVPEKSPRRGTRAAQQGQARIEISILGVLLDFPELLADRALLEHASALQGDLALAVAVLRRAHSHDPAHLDSALAKLPENLRPFAEARATAPLYTDLEAAQRELTGNLKKLLQLEHSRMSKHTALEIERARLEGNVDQEFELLRALEQRARQRQGI